MTNTATRDGIAEDTVAQVSQWLQAACAPCLQGDQETACAHLDRATMLVSREAVMTPESTRLWWGFGRHLLYSWMLVSRWELLVRLLRIAPWDAATTSSLLHALHFLPECNPEELADLHRQWGIRFAPAGAVPTYSRTRDPQRRLRVGYLSPDFRAHCVATFFEGVLAAHDRGVVEVIGYGNVAPEQCDAVTARLVSKFDRYCDIWDLDDAAVAEQIGRDNIDILVDLAGHTHNHRLGVLARRPAPVQVTYLGYPNTTGLTQCDYRLTDAQADSPESQTLYTETLIALDTCFACFTPPEGAPEIVEPPVQARGSITFGSFVGSAKHNPVLLACWARILRAMSDARLLLRFADAQQPVVQQQCRQAMARLGVDPRRILLDGLRGYAEHLATYGQVDIALDSFPWSSHTSLCEALWMGVPVVTRQGRSFVSRMGHSVLHHAGLETFSAADETAYVEKAIGLARQGETLTRLRRGLRDRLRNSVVCDANRQARALERAYRTMWRKLCD